MLYRRLCQMRELVLPLTSGTAECTAPLLTSYYDLSSANFALGVVCVLCVFVRAIPKMPFRRRYRRKRAFGRPFKRRRLNIRRKGRKTRITRIKLRGPALMPDSLMVKLKWYTRSVFTLSSDQVEQAVQFRSNDIYLPTATATTRAMGFQEYITLYDRWIVHASRIVVKIFQVAVGASANVSEWILYPSNDTTTEAIEVARQYPYSKTTICGIQSSGAQ